MECLKAVLTEYIRLMDLFKECPVYAVADLHTSVAVSPVHGHQVAEIVESATAMTAEYLTPVSRPRVVRIEPDTTADDGPKYQQLDTALREHGILDV